MLKLRFQSDLTLSCFISLGFTVYTRLYSPARSYNRELSGRERQLALLLALLVLVSACWCLLLTWHSCSSCFISLRHFLVYTRRQEVTAVASMAGREAVNALSPAECLLVPQPHLAGRTTWQRGSLPGYSGALRKKKRTSKGKTKTEVTWWDVHELPTLKIQRYSAGNVSVLEEKIMENVLLMGVWVKAGREKCSSRNATPAVSSGTTCRQRMEGLRPKESKINMTCNLHILKKYVIFIVFNLAKRRG